MSRRSKAQWRELISQQQSSGLSAAEFCRRESINPKYFSTRKVQLSEVGSSFVEVARSSKAEVSMPPRTIELRVIEIEVPSDCLSDVLKQLRQ